MRPFAQRSGQTGVAGEDRHGFSRSRSDFPQSRVACRSHKKTPLRERFVKRAPSRRSEAGRPRGRRLSVRLSSSVKRDNIEVLPMRSPAGCLPRPPGSRGLTPDAPPHRAPASAAGSQQSQELERIPTMHSSSRRRFLA